MSRTTRTAILALATTLWSLGAYAEGDPASGEKIFNRCKACHVVTEEKNRVGPHLVELFGRPAGSLDDFRYSPGMRDSGIIWDQQSLDAYLESPRKIVPGTRMAFAGLRNEKDRQDVIAYLRSATGAE